MKFLKRAMLGASLFASSLSYGETVEIEALVPISALESLPDSVYAPVMQALAGIDSEELVKVKYRYRTYAEGGADFVGPVEPPEVRERRDREVPERRDRLDRDRDRDRDEDCEVEVEIERGTNTSGNGRAGNRVVGGQVEAGHRDSERIVVRVKGSGSAEDCAEGAKEIVRAARGDARP